MRDVGRGWGNGSGQVKKGLLWWLFSFLQNWSCQQWRGGCKYWLWLSLLICVTSNGGQEEGQKRGRREYKEPAKDIFVFKQF